MVRRRGTGIRSTARITDGFSVGGAAAGWLRAPAIAFMSLYSLATSASSRTSTCTLALSAGLLMPSTSDCTRSRIV